MNHEMMQTIGGAVFIWTSCGSWIKSDSMKNKEDKPERMFLFFLSLSQAIVGGYLIYRGTHQ